MTNSFPLSLSTSRTPTALTSARRRVPEPRANMKLPLLCGGHCLSAAAAAIVAAAWQGFRLDAYVVVGTLRGGEPHTWVVTLEQ